MRRKGVGLLAIGIAILLGGLAITAIMFIFWLFTFKIHIFQRIIEEYHYNRVQEIPLTIISSDYEREGFVEKFNKAYYGFYSQQEIENFKEVVKKNTTAQVGEAYWWYLVIENLRIGKSPYELCRVREIIEKSELPPYEETRYCYCSGCPIYKKVKAEIYSCEAVLPLSECLGSLTVNITFFNDTFPFPLVFNGIDDFIARMVFNAYA